TLDNDEQVAERLISKIGKPKAFREITNAFEVCHNDTEEVICYSKRVLTDFYSKFNKKNAMKINELKERRSRKVLNIIIPTRTEIKEFMSQEAIKELDSITISYKVP
ncbi:13723_t:CDS:2, partial [Funneliformis geosporum]